MKSLFKGIVDHFNKQYSSSGSSVHYAVYSDVSGQIYATEGPQSSTSAPYIVFNLVSNLNDETFGNEAEEALVQFNIFSTNASVANVNSIYDHLTTRFDGAALASLSSGYTNTMCKREFSHLVRSDDTWHYVIQYRMRITK